MSTKRFTRIRMLAALIALPLLAAVPAHAQLVVSDPGNAVLLVEQLAQQAQQIDNQVQQIQNQIQSLQNQKNMLAHLNFSNAGQALAAMQQIQQALRMFCIELQSQGASDSVGFGAGYNCALVADALRSLFPAPADWPGQSDAQIAAYPDQWDSQQRAAAAKQVQVQDASVADMATTQQRMSDLATASQSASGQTAAIQVTNQMLVTLAAQLQDQQTAELATQRALALQQEQDAAEDARNNELIARATADAQTSYDLQVVSDPFSGN